MCHTGLNVKLESKEVTHRFDPVFIRNTFLYNEIRAGILTNVPNYKLLKILVQKMYGIIIYEILRTNLRKICMNDRII